MVDRAQPLVQDANFDEDLTLPTADGTVQTTGFDLGAMSARGAFLAQCELRISSPALNTTQLPNDDTLTYSVEACDDNSSWDVVLADEVLVQTGAGGAGAAAAVARFRLPSDCPRYIRVKAIAAGGTGDISGASADVSLLF